VAESKRRDEDAVDERLDDELDEDAPNGVDALTDDEFDTDVDDEFDNDDELENDDDLESEEDLDEPQSGRGGAATRRRRAIGRARNVSVSKKSTKAKDLDRVGAFARLRNFVREVIAELRKVIWPTRKELLTYTAVVIVFVTIMFTIVSSLDFGFGKAMFWIFGSGK
jgi:preprotein translocase subunit SecE